MLNPNEPDAVMVERRVAEGTAVSAGDVLCVLETSKSTEEFTAEAGGYIIGWTAGPGEMVSAGNLLCYLADTADWSPPRPESRPGSASTTDEATDDLPTGLRISQPAIELARNHGVDLHLLPVGPLVTVAMIQTHLVTAAGSDLTTSPLASGSSGPIDEPVGQTLRAEAVIVYGGGGHGRTLVDLIRSLGVWQLVGVVDQRLTEGESVLGAAVLGGDDALERLRADGVGLVINGVGGIARATDRVDAFERL
ncbi:MAG: biotin/lipoyl-containing protein, partial [Pseudonocardiaceae bacterium]